MAENKFKFLVESFKVSEEAKDTSSTKVTGLALPIGKVSRNGFAYDPESIKETYKTLEGVPVCFNHDSNQVLGHVTSVALESEGVTYEMDLDSEEAVVKKVRRGDITKVSIQCIYDQDKSSIDAAGIVHAYIKEFLELSIVTIPGFADTSATVVESLREIKSKSKEGKMAEQEKQNAASEDATKNPGKAKEADNPDDKKDEPKDDKSDKILAKLDELATEIAKANASLEEMKTASEEKCGKKGKQSDEEDPKKEVPKDEEKLREEALKNDKKTGMSQEGYTSESSKVLTEKDLKEAFKKVR